MFSGSDKSDSDDDSVYREQVTGKEDEPEHKKDSTTQEKIVKKIETIIREKEYTEEESLRIAQKFTTSEFYEAGRDQQGGCVVTVSRESVPRRCGKGPLVGRAISVMYRSNNTLEDKEPQYWIDFIQFLQSIPGPKVLVPSDITKGEGTRSTTCLLNPQMAKHFQSLGVVGINTDSSVSHAGSLDDMNFIAFADSLCVRGGPSYATPLKWSAAIKTGSHTVESPVIHCDDSGLVAVHARHVPAIAQALLSPVVADETCCDIIARASVQVPRPPKSDQASDEERD